MFGTSNATSLHPGGVNLTMADGSVRFVKEQVNLNTWWAVGTRNGNEAAQRQPVLSSVGPIVFEPPTSLPRVYPSARAAQRCPRSASLHPLR